MITQSFCKFCGGFIRNVHGNVDKKFDEQHVNTVECLQTLGDRITSVEVALAVMQVAARNAPTATDAKASVNVIEVEP